MFTRGHKNTHKTLRTSNPCKSPPFSLNYKPQLNELTANKIWLSPAVHLVGHLGTLSLSFTSLKAAILETNRDISRRRLHTGNHPFLAVSFHYDGTTKGWGGDMHYQDIKESFKLELKPLGRWQIHCDARNKLSHWLNSPLKIFMIWCSRDWKERELDGSD